jgi:hypothetical protein
LHHLAAMPRASPGRPRRYLVRTLAPPIIQSRVESRRPPAAQAVAVAIVGKLSLLLGLTLFLGEATASQRAYVARRRRILLQRKVRTVSEMSIMTVPDRMTVRDGHRTVTATFRPTQLFRASRKTGSYEGSVEELTPILRANGRRSPAFRRRSFARIARRDISSALNGTPAPQGRPGSEDPEDVAHASCAATWRSPDGWDTIAFPGLPLL